MIVQKIVHAEALVLLSKLPDKSVDHIITDPPYNISQDGKQTMVGPNIVDAKFGDWDCIPFDQYKINFAELLRQFFRVAKDHSNCLIWLDKTFAGYAFTKMQYEEWKDIGWIPRNLIGAVKNNPGRKMRKNNLKSTWEGCLWLSKDTVQTLNWDTSNGGMKNFFNYNIGVEKVSDHPTEKYEAMIEPLVEMYTNENDVILDPFCGSGTTPKICKQKRRGYIAGDKDIKWATFTKHRLDCTPEPIL